VTRETCTAPAWADRTAALSALPGIEQVFPFENRGEEIGVTIRHPHGQIYGYPYVTPRTQQLIRSVAAYGPGLFAGILAREQAGSGCCCGASTGPRSFPSPPHWPLEVHLLPHAHVPDFAHSSEAQRDELALLYLRLLRGVDAVYPTPTPYIAAWHQAPVRVHRADLRLHLQLTSPRRAADRLKYLAGSEAAMGAWVADVPPEQQAGLLRAAIARADREHPV
jgi:UDPglucose--hexose-1-phosphate uridylyltransferase